MMHNNAMTMLMPDESVIKLVEKEVKIICENGHRLEAVLFTKGNSKDSVTGKSKGKGRKCGKCNERDRDQDSKGTLRCSYSNPKAQYVWNWQSTTCSEPPTT
jgi:hypothetical protein